MVRVAGYALNFRFCPRVAGRVCPYIKHLTIHVAAAMRRDKCALKIEAPLIVKMPHARLFKETDSMTVRHNRKYLH